MTLSLAGLGTLLAASAAAFTLLRWIGAACLVYLGVMLWRAMVSADAAPPLGAAAAFRQAYVVTALNPKGIAFFVAFVPQFVLPSAPFLPWPTVYGYFRAFLNAGVWDSTRHHLVVMLRESAGRDPSPTAAVIDSQSVKTTESGGPRGYDAAKTVVGRKRHIAVDTQGLLLGVVVHAASI